MKINEQGLYIIKTSEGCRLKAYKCPAGILTIGYGHTGSDVNEDTIITQEQAEILLKKDVEAFEKKINALGLHINENQFSALVSFAYNLGFGALLKSTLLKKIVANPSDPTIKNEFMKWVNAGGKKLQGLVERRTREANLYFL